MSSDNPRPVPLFHGDYRDKEEPSLWFAQFQLSLPDNYLDAQRVRRLKMQMAPGSMADQWFDDVAISCSSFSQFQAEFISRWPPPKPPKYSRAQQKERVMAQVLKEEDIGVWLPGEPTGNYGHVTWATKVMRIAMGMGDSAGLLVEYAVEGIPNVLKDHLTCSYSSWQEFLQDVESVPAVKLKRAKEDLNMNRTRDADIAQLKAQSSSAFNTLPFQFSQMTMDNSRPTQPSYRASRTYANANNFLSATPSANLMAMPTQATPVATVNRFARGAGPNAMGWRNNPFVRPTLTRAQIMEKLNTLPQRQATEAGRRQYEADVDAWHRMHGTEGTPSLERPYPLRPGTAVVGSGECYTCGMITEPMHLSSQCVATETLRPQESRWRQYIAAMLRRAAPAQAPAQTYTVSPAQYTPQATHTYYQQYGVAPAPVFAVQEDQGCTYYAVSSL
ncbi:hypothetical protein EV424DRAFT_1353400 [Suillus variegatus]|nr:hypothetical protein EV424DRAFT_1353400 [Suillus variegatus]